MKVIQNCEVRKLRKMILSDDKEMRQLASEIINVKEPFRFGMGTILFFNLIITILHLYAIVFFTYMGAGWYFVPLIIGFIFQILMSLAYIFRTSDERKEYCNLADKIDDYGN